MTMPRLINRLQICCLVGLAVCTVITTSLAAPPLVDVNRDVVSPAYNWNSFPYAWSEIQAGNWKPTPVHWRRSAANPIVNAGMNSRPIQLDPQTVRVYYGVRGPGKGIYYFDVDVDQPAKIKSGPSGPIITTGAPGEYDSEWVISPEPVRISATHLRMYYSAKAAGDFFQKVWTLAAADSFDNGVTWNKLDANPLLQATDEPWECGAVGFCSVELTDGHWKMWYLGTDNVQNATKQVGYATSDDGVAWKRYAHNPVIAVDANFAWEARAIAVPRVIRDGRIYKVWYCCYENNNTYAIGQAESLDGLNWSRSPHNPVMLAEKNDPIAKSMIAYPGAIHVGQHYLLWYSGDGYGAKGIGLAVASEPQQANYFRIGDTPQVDATWSTWSALENQEPPRRGYIQFATLQTSE